MIWPMATFQRLDAYQRGNELLDRVIAMLSKLCR